MANMSYLEDFCGDVAPLKQMNGDEIREVITGLYHQWYKIGDIAEGDPSLEDTIEMALDYHNAT